MNTTDMNTRKYGWFARMAMVMMTLALTLTLWAEPPPLKGFAGPGFGYDASGKSNFIASANSYNGGVVRLTYIAATGGNADNVANIYGPTETSVVITAASGPGVNLPVGRTNGFAENDVVVIRYRATDTYARGVLAALPTSTNLVLTATSSAAVAVAAGDIVYKLESVGKFTVGSAAVGSPTIINAPSGCFWAKRPGPVLLNITGTSVAALGFTVVAGDYQ